MSVLALNSTMFSRLRVFAYRVLRRIAALIEPRDSAQLDARLQHGDIVWRAFKQAAEAAIRSGRLDDAERYVARGLAAFPDDHEFLIDQALVAHNAGRYALAAERWRGALAAAPDRPLCHAGLAANLRELGDFDAAQATIETGLALFPNDLNLITEAARIAGFRARFGDALTLWQRAVATPKPHPDWLQGHAHTLEKLGDFDEADVAIKAARADFPDHHGLMGVEGSILVSRQKWPEAIAHWTEYRRRFPNDPIGWEQLGLAIQGGQLHAESEPTSDEVFRPALPATIDVVDDEVRRDLMLRFESIGDNCELGLVQRRYAAEPLGLLRWNTVSYDRLLEALGRRFEGMGDEANTEIAVASNGEFFVQDRRWYLGMHTFLYEGQTDRETLHKKMCRRVVYLREKLLEDLAASQKIFVYRSHGLDEARLDLLHKALRAFGPVRLLAVQPARTSRQTGFEGEPGDLVEVSEGRYVGFLSRSGADPQGNWNIAFDDWASICRKAAAFA